MSSIKEEYIKHKYIKNDEFVTDGVTIMECRDVTSRDIIDNGRLGNYDKNGKYVILNSIKDELIKLPKVVTLTSASTSFSGGNDVYEVKGNIPIFGDIKFKLVVNNNMATFFLVEKVNRDAGGVLEIYEEQLEAIDLKREALDLPFIFSYFNISNGDIDLGQKWSEINIPNILTRKVYMAALSKKMKEIPNQDSEEQSFNESVELLKNSGSEYGEKILKKLDETMTQKPEFATLKGTNAYGKALNDILFGTINTVNSQEEELTIEEKELYQELMELRNQQTKDIISQAKNEVSNDDVETAVIKINTLMKEGQLDEEFLNEFPDAEETPQIKKAILKQKAENEAAETATASDVNEDGSPKTKEQKIKEILEGKKKATSAKKAPPKKLKPAAKKPSSKKMSAKGKKKAKGKAAGKKKKKAKKPVVKKAVKGLKPGKPKEKVSAPKKKKKKKKSDDLYRSDIEFLRSLIVSPPEALTFHFSEGPTVIEVNTFVKEPEPVKEDVVILSTQPTLQEREENPFADVHKLTNDENNILVAQKDSDLSKGLGADMLTGSNPQEGLLSSMDHSRVIVDPASNQNADQSSLDLLNNLGILNMDSLNNEQNFD